MQGNVCFCLTYFTTHRVLYRLSVNNVGHIDDLLFTLYVPLFYSFAFTVLYH